MAEPDGFRLLLVRHGQTPSNVAKIIDTALPGPPLSDEGQRQAATLAKELGDERVVGVYASRMVRSQQTAQPVAARHDLRVSVEDGVHEVDAGELHGRTDDEAYQLFLMTYRAWHLQDPTRRMPGGENAQQVLERFLPVVAQIRDTHATGTAVLISHGAAARLAAAALAENVPPDFAADHYLPNATSVLLVPDGADRWRCLRWHDVPFD